MTAVAYTQWLPAVQIHVPECPTPMITEAVRSTCIRFCGESRYLREELDPFNTVETDEEYEIAAPADCAIAEILSLRVDGTQLKPTTVDALENEVVDWQDLTGRPTRYFQFPMPPTFPVPLSPSSRLRLPEALTSGCSRNGRTP